MSKKPLKIALAGTRGIPNNYGGFEQCADYLSRGLVDRGHDVTVYSSSRHPYKAGTYQNVQIVYCFDPGFGAFGQFIYDLNCILHARKQGFDVIVQFGYTSSSIWSFLWPKAAKHLVNTDGIEHQRDKFRPVVKQFLKLAEEWAIHAADIVIADNKGIASYVSHKYPKAKIREIAYGATNADPASKDSNLLHEYHLESENFDLLICRMEPENQVHTIISAHLKSKTALPLVVVGKTQINNYGRALKKEYAGNRIVFLEGVYDKTKLDALRLFCRFYFHGHSVGGTNPSLLEAMTTCKHIIAHGNDYNQSVLLDQGTYFTNEQNLLITINQLDGLNENTDFSIQTRGIIEQNYSWEKIIQQYETACYEAMEA